MNILFNENKNDLLYKLDNPDVIINLLKKGYDPNIKNKDNISPFMYLTMYYYNKNYFSKLFKIFIEYGAVDYNNNNINILILLLKYAKDNSLFIYPYINYIELINLLIYNDKIDLYIDVNNLNIILNEIYTSRSDVLMKSFIKKYINKLDVNNSIIDAFIRDNLYKILNYFIEDFDFSSLLLNKLKNCTNISKYIDLIDDDITPIYKILSSYPYKIDDINHIHKMIELYLINKINPNIAPINHDNPLMIAIKYNLYDLIKLLIINKADPFYEHYSNNSSKYIKFPYEICNTIEQYNILMDLYNKYYPNIILNYSFTKSKESYGKIYGINKQYKYLKDKSDNCYNTSNIQNNNNKNFKNFNNINNIKKIYRDKSIKHNSYYEDESNNSELSDFFELLSDDDNIDNDEDEKLIEYDEFDYF